MLKKLGNKNIVPPTPPSIDPSSLFFKLKDSSTACVHGDNGDDAGNFFYVVSNVSTLAGSIKTPITALSLSSGAARTSLNLPAN